MLAKLKSSQENRCPDKEVNKNDDGRCRWWPSNKQLLLNNLQSALYKLFDFVRVVEMS